MKKVNNIKYMLLCYNKNCLKINKKGEEVELEILLCIAGLFIFRNLIKKILKITFNIIFIPIMGLIISLIIDTTFLTGLIFVVVLNVILEEFKKKIRRINREIFKSSKRYNYGSVEKFIYSMVDINILTMTLIIGFLVLKELIRPTLYYDSIEIALIGGLVLLVLKTIDSSLKNYIFKITQKKELI